MKTNLVTGIVVLAVASAFAVQARTEDQPAAVDPVIMAAAIKPVMSSTSAIESGKPARNEPAATAAAAASGPAAAIEPAVEREKRTSKARRFARRLLGGLAAAAFAATYVVEP